MHEWKKAENEDEGKQKLQGAGDCVEMGWIVFAAVVLSLSRVWLFVTPWTVAC